MPSRLLFRACFFAFLLLIVGHASAQGQPQCTTTSDFKGSTEPGELRVLQSLKGAVRLGGNTPCSGALVTFAGRSASSPALVLSAGHCSDRGKAEVIVGEKSGHARPGRGALPRRHAAAAHSRDRQQ